jgi:D-3-phosphoglycerate dehydrogenase
VEALDELSKIVLSASPERDKTVAEIASITQQGMAGTIGFTESLERRLTLFAPDKDAIAALINLLKQNISLSVERNAAWFRENADHIYIISGGFTEYIVPVVAAFGIDQSHVLANSFVYDVHGKVVGFDKNNLLAQPLGKVKQLDALKLDGEIVVIGDGYTDYQIKEHGKADVFYAFVENVSRGAVTSKANKVITSFDFFK